MLISLSFYPIERLVTAQTTNYKSYAIFLYTRYIEWPTENRADFNITIVGKSKVTSELIPLMQNKTVAGKKITVSQVNTLEEVGNAQLVYVSNHKSSDLANILERVSGKATLVVTERGGQVKKGQVLVLLYMMTTPFILSSTAKHLCLIS
jgi:acetyl/propionyl-CoA carboxylase alpha subunit